MNNLMIETLVDNLTPTKVLKNKNLYGFYTLTLVMFAFVVISFFGLRVDYKSALDSGSMFWKPAIFLLASLGGLYAMSSLARPQGRLSIITLGFIGLSIALMTWQAIIQYPNISLAQISDSFGKPTASLCLLVTVVGGMLLTFAFWKLWLNKTASTRPVLLGALSGFTSANIAATGYALHCNMDGVLYILGFYGFGVLALTGLGAIFGKKVLNW